MANITNPPTKHQKGRRWATSTLVICGMFSIWANVRSGQIATEPVIVSVFPPVVAFFSSHLISYFNPTKSVHKLVIYGGFGLVCAFSMYGSGWHIYDYVSSNGQHWTTAIIYIFITDAPMLLAAGILVEKVPTGKNTTVSVKQTQPAKKAVPPKKTNASRKTTPAKTPKLDEIPDILLDPFEKDMLNA